MLLNLRSAIAARQMRQVDLAISLKIAPSVLSEIVNGRRGASASLRAQIAQALQADESWLFSSVVRIPALRANSDTESSPAPAMACAAKADR